MPNTQLAPDTPITTAGGISAPRLAARETAADFFLLTSLASAVVLLAWVVLLEDLAAAALEMIAP